MQNPTLALIQNIGIWQLLIILALGLLIFGRKLPEVGRSMARGIVEFRRGLKGMEDEIEDEVNRPRSSSGQLEGGRSSGAKSPEQPRVSVSDRVD